MDRDEYDIDEFNYPSPEDEDYPPEDWEDREDSLTDAEADALTLAYIYIRGMASIGLGTEEDYGHFGGMDLEPPF